MLRPVVKRGVGDVMEVRAKGQIRAVQLFRVKGDRLGGEYNDF